MTISTTTAPSPQMRSAARTRAPRLSLSKARIHFASDPRAGYRAAPRLRLTRGLVGRR